MPAVVATSIPFPSVPESTQTRQSGRRLSSLIRFHPTTSTTIKNRIHLKSQAQRNVNAPCPPFARAVPEEQTMVCQRNSVGRKRKKKTFICSKPQPPPDGTVLVQAVSGHTSLVDFIYYDLSWEETKANTFPYRNTPAVKSSRPSPVTPVMG
jgi:hypothetical protein